MQLPHQNPVDNPQGRASMLLVCDHASNFVPAGFGALGLGLRQLEDHIAWDIGARALARELAVLLDAPLVCARASRLLVDPNRAFDAADLIPAEADGNPIPGNIGLDAGDRRTRIDAFHEPYHAAIEAALAARPWITGVVSVHSFTPRLNGFDRPWHVGILHDEDARLADRLIAALSAHRDITVGRNQPYAPDDGVYYTLGRHAAGREAAMIEVRNDQLRDEIGQQRWAKLLADALGATITA
ncbi:MAG: N-formylglutamate amidohydrolase [Erythrobacter sp.]